MRRKVIATRVGCNMAESGAVGFDSSQVKKAVQALLAYQKNKDNANSLLLNEHDRIVLMLTVWKIPERPQVIKIPVPHGIRPESLEVCLFTRDEPGMSYDQTEKFYRKLLSQHGIKQITEVIPLQKLKKEYKPFEAKRRLLGNFDLFLSDDRIRRFLPSQLGKHFYKEKREPISVDLKAKNLAAKLNRFIQGTQLHITNKGCCYSVRVGHTGMDVDQIVENAAAVATVLARKLPMGWTNVKLLHLKTQTSVALPVYNSPLNNLDQLNASSGSQKRKQRKKKQEVFQPLPVDSTVTSEVATAPIEQPEEEEDEAIPELVPIPATAEKEEKKKTEGKKTPAKKPKAGVKRQAPVESEEVPSTPKGAGEKRRANKVKNGDPTETPSKQKKGTPLKLKNTEDDEQDSLPKRSSLKKTPKKTGVKSSVKLTKSAKKAPQTPKLKQKKRMKTPQSV
ncbi:ribosomal L1 domain-containing protein 1 [Spea bombifrons]|uniref:ribosomal L1 domain-containing protein 1 n=1 Tax=Spea bombifrons TaxID=233779 RepID=UPI00234B6CB6|nr:ribosomal L1 domain-containing protein 1 [Spea bombifrons]